MEEVVIKINVAGTETSVRNVKELKDTINKLKQEAETANFGSKRLNELNAAIEQSDAELKKLTKTLGGVDNAASKIDLEKVGKNFERASKGMSGSIALVTGAMTLFGGENQKVQENLLKVQAAMAISTGVKDLSEAFKGLDLTTKGLNKSLMANPYLLIAAAIIGLLAATGKLDDLFKILGETMGDLAVELGPVFKQLGKALEPLLDLIIQLLPVVLQLSSGFIALKLVGKYLELLSPVINIITNAMDKLVEIVDIGIGYFEEFLDWLGKIANQIYEFAEGIVKNNPFYKLAESFGLLKEKQDEYKVDLEGLKKSQEDFRKSNALLNAELDRTIALRTAQGASARELEALEMKRLEMLTQQAKAEYDVALAIKARIVAQGNLNEVSQEQIDAFNEVEQNYLNAQNNEKILEANQYKARSDRGKEYAQKKLELERTLQDELNKIQSQAIANETKLIQDTFDYQINSIKGNSKADRELRVQLENEKIMAIADINKKALEQEAKEKIIALERQIADTKGNDTISINLRSAYADEILQIQEKLNNDLHQEEVNANQETLKNTAEFTKEELELFVENKKAANEILNNLDDARYNRRVQALESQIGKEIELLQAQFDQEKILRDRSMQEELDEQSQRLASGEISEIEYQELIKGIKDKYREDELASEEAFNEQVKQQKQAAAQAVTDFIFSSAQQLTGLIQQIINQSADEQQREIDNRINAINEQYDSEIARAKELGKDTTQLEKEKTKVIEAEQKKKNKIARDAWEANKAIQIVNSIIQTAQGVLSAYSAAAATPIIGPILGPIAAVTAGIFGGVQTALIASQTYPGDSGGGGGSANPAASPSVPSFNPSAAITNQAFGTGAEQEQTFGEQTANGNQSINLNVSISDNEINTVRNSVSQIENRASLDG